MAIIVGRLDRNAPSKSVKVTNPLGGKTVVVVDDSPTQRKKLRELYESLGVKCVGEAADGMAGLSVVEEKKPDLVSLDIIMPVMHGIEAIGYLRSGGFKGVIILVSAVGSVEAVAEIRSQGFSPDAIFSKKDSRETFGEVLAEIFSSEEYSGEQSTNENPSVQAHTA